MKKCMKFGDKGQMSYMHWNLIFFEIYIRDFRLNGGSRRNRPPARRTRTCYSRT